MSRYILFFITEDWYFWSHRLPVARAARDAGFKVIIATRTHRHKERIEKEGFEIVPLKLERRNTNLFKELICIFQIIRIYRQKRPVIAHHVGLKPVLYGSLAARLCGAPGVVNALAGLGYIFVGKSLKASILKRFAVFAYRLAFSGRNTIGIFQNPEDLEVFIDAGIVKSEKAVLIRGSGVDTLHFINCPELASVPTIVLASRMLWNKGVGELVDAARQLAKDEVNFRIVLVGIPDSENPASIPKGILSAWQDEGIVEWWGHSEDMPQVLSKAHIVALPTTYGEGVPKILLEAASSGRPIVATDVPGCREIVRNNENGFLIPPHDSRSLANALKILVNDPKLRRRMGARGREIVEAEFSEEHVVKETLDVYRGFLGEKPSSTGELSGEKRYEENESTCYRT